MPAGIAENLAFVITPHAVHTAGAELFEAGTRQRTGGVTLLKDRVTGVVGLSAVPQLPTPDGAGEEWNQTAETTA